MNRSANEIVDPVGGVLEHGSRQPRVQTDPEDTAHDEVRTRQVAHYTIFDILISRLADQVASEQAGGYRF